jgi:PIN domain nuclease of toxin-antitoxin system
VTLLLDTHAFLWIITDDAQLSATGKSLITDPNNEIPRLLAVGLGLVPESQRPTQYLSMG